MEIIDSLQYTQNALGKFTQSTLHIQLIVNRFRFTPDQPKGRA